MENIYEKLPILSKTKLNTEQLVLENNITINAEDEIVKVLSVGADIDLSLPSECLNGECNLMGNVVLNIVYLCANGTVNNQTATSPFNHKIQNANIDAFTKINAVANVIASQVDKIQSNQIKILTTLNFDVVAIKNVEKEYLKETSGTTYVKQQAEKIVSFDKQSCDKFEEQQAVLVKDGVKKVLMTTSQISVKEYFAGTNFISVEGELQTKILYVNNQEIPELQTITINKQFKQEFEADGVTKETDLSLFAVILHEKVAVELTEKENNEVEISVVVPIMVCYNTFKCNEILSATDVYSTENVLSLTKNDCVSFENLPPEILEGKIEGNVVLGDTEPRIDKFMAVANVKNVVSNCYVNDGNLFLEGITSANIVYLNDETGSLQSVEIEIPYVLDKKVDFCADVILEPHIAIYDVDVMIKRGREIYFDAKAKSVIGVTSKKQLCMIEKVEKIGDVAERENAVEIYFARAGETFWDIAKNLNIPTETIYAQNPELVDPLEKDENIAIYFQKQRKR